MTSPDTSVDALYFGCARGIGGRRDAGHYFYEPRSGSLHESMGRNRLRYEEMQPWGYVDGKLAPFDPAYRKVEMPQGVAALLHKDGWTALAFWDRTGDARPNSNSNFFLHEHLDFDQAVARARELFPALFERFNFELRSA